MRYEIKKVFASRFIVLLLLVVVIANAWLFYRNCVSPKAEYTLLQVKEKYNWSSEELERQNEELNRLIDLYYDEDEIPVSTELITGNLYAEIDLNNEILTRKNENLAYRAYLDELIREAEFKTDSGLFGTEGSFSVRVQQETIKRYARLRGVVLEDSFSGAVELLSGWSMSDVLVLLFGLLPSLILLTQEKSDDVLVLLKSLKRGHSYLWFQKLASLVWILMTGILLIYGTDILISVCLLGGADLSHPIQSVYGFRSCPIPLTVFGFYACFLGVKFLCVLTVSVLFLAVCCIVDGLLVQFVSGVGLAALFAWIGSSGSLWLRAMSIMRLYKTKELFQSCLFLNFLENPIPYLPASILFCAVLLTGGAAIGCVVFCHRCAVKSSRVKTSLKFFRFGRSASLLAHETRKLMIICRAAPVLCLMLLLQCFIYYDYPFPKSSWETYYKAYAVRLSGPPNVESEAYLRQEEARYAEIHEEIAEYQELAKGDENLFLVMTRKLRIQLLPENAYQFVQNQYACLTGEQEFIYKTPYEFLFNREGRQEDLLDLLKLFTVLILTLSPYYSLDGQTGVDILIQTVGSTKNVRRRKLYLTVVMIILSTLTAFLPRILAVLNYYGLPQLHAPANSLAIFSRTPDSWSVLTVLLFTGCVRFMLGVFAAGMIRFFSKKTKNAITVMLLSTGTLIFPAIVYYLTNLSK